ncbi:uncharacterized protein LOC113227080 [Hyposmocoma kahamanoa]|uniref:uncharacterized protein LOC113227080 n=1 Tax=Hyposmocoma kahamanoa TaxID=1477025 RepID=UPI000E6D9D85|nr:uncharacterized protein LOC113227080 [Hyposmocoma kahamanoa]
MYEGNDENDKTEGTFGRSLSYSSEDVNRDDMQIEEEKCTNNMRATKRDREEETDNEWTTVQKTKKGKTETIQVYISNKEKLPKQFALAKIFKEYNINHISRVKYLSPYRARIDFENEEGLEKLYSCKYFDEQGFKLQDSMNVNLSYGIIKSVDLDLSEEDILKEIHCPNSTKLISVQRLQRRDRIKESDWIPSETVRLCFQGSYLPPYVYVANLKIHVDRYVFPVSQCARCWRLGHSTKRCPYQKIICPKCGNNHANCDTKTFKCVNCGGNHMALDKICPAYVKEKTIRELMSDYNCTYRKALLAYVPREEITITKKTYETLSATGDQNNTGITYPQNTSQSRSYAEIVTTTATIENPPNCYRKPTLRTSKNANIPKKKNQSKPENEWDMWSLPVYGSADELTDCGKKEPRKQEQPERGVEFNELLSRISDIIFLKKCNLQLKVKQIISVFVEWLILVIVNNLSDWPMLKGIVESITGFNGS